MSESYEKLKNIVDGVAVDVEKAVKGNKAASTRVRKVMQEVKAVCGDVRRDMLAIRFNQSN